MKRWQEIVLIAVISAVAVPVLLIAALGVIGMTIEGYGEHLERRDRCLKAATNGYEIERCK